MFTSNMDFTLANICEYNSHFNIHKYNPYVNIYEYKFIWGTCLRPSSSSYSHYSSSGGGLDVGQLKSSSGFYQTWNGFPERPDLATTRIATIRSRLGEAYLRMEPAAILGTKSVTIGWNHGDWYKHE
ncbi:hypothetical protein GSI_08608 [Ganoderma sinense ZZ0214-1]|uniref:Uncharacterized protein n=1 Tax=Ganoderma sinense ZZ0214-1 TaxID=1077348 RepID=A0A2G8S4B3_9APHY|nr:hypothetical protein GSI_08608 [Ganoderma sinense ZZ0214-1]